MGYALVNMRDRYIGRIPARHFSVVKETDLVRFQKALDDGDLVAVQVKDARRVGPRPLRGRYKHIMQLALASREAAPEPTPEETPPEPTPEETPPEPPPEPPPEETPPEPPPEEITPESPPESPPAEEAPEPEAAPEGEPEGSPEVPPEDPAPEEAPPSTEEEPGS